MNSNHAEIAQSVEHFTRNEGVVSSSLIFGFSKPHHECGFHYAQAHKTALRDERRAGSAAALPD